MDDNRPVSKQRCKAMIDAGIYDPESKDGIDFCVNFCPYEYCVVLDYKVTACQLKRRGKANFARDLKGHGVSVDDIALILDVQLRTVMRYLKK